MLNIINEIETIETIELTKKIENMISMKMDIAEAYKLLDDYFKNSFCYTVYRGGSHIAIHYCAKRIILVKENK